MINKNEQQTLNKQQSINNKQQQTTDNKGQQQKPNNIKLQKHNNPLKTTKKTTININQQQKGLDMPKTTKTHQRPG